MSVDSMQASDVSKLNAACAKGMELQMAGQIDLAGQLYRAVLQAVPNHSTANYCLGMLHVQSQQAAEGIPYLKTALMGELEVPDYWLGYLEALTLLGRTTAARNILALGRQHGLAGAAVEDFAKRLEAHAAQPTMVVPGLAQAQLPTAPLPSEKSNKAARALMRKGKKTRRADQRPARQQETSLLALVGQGRNVEIIALARGLTERFPERGLGWKILGAFMTTDAGYEPALGVLRTAVRLLPTDAEAHVNLGVTLAKTKRFAEAESHLRTALTLDPGLVAANYRLGMTYELQGRYAEAEASLRRGRAMAIKTTNVAGDDELSYSHLLFLTSHNPLIDADALFAEHRGYGQYVEEPLRARWAGHANSRDPQRCLKVGFVSGDLYEHSVGQFFEPLAAQLARFPTLALHAYCSNPIDDALSRRLQAHFKTWTPVGALSDDALAEKIRADGIDLLIDLSGHTGHNRLPVFARKPAPVQLSWLGYPGTTGLQSMDYYLADQRWLPPGQFDRMFTEKLAYLPDRWAFQPHASAPPVGPLPALSAGRLTFGSFHRMGKLNPFIIKLWSQLLLALPQATLLLSGIRLDGQEQRLREQFAAHGIEPERLICHARSTMDIYLAAHNQVDIALDTQPYAGATTTMHSLSMGVPTLTLVGATPQARACAGILANIGLEQFIAADAADFVVKACYWAAHLTELAALRAGLRSRLLDSPAGHPELIAAHLEQALRHMWREWCAERPAKPFNTQQIPVTKP